MTKFPSRYDVTLVRRLIVIRLLAAQLRLLLIIIILDQYQCSSTSEAPINFAFSGVTVMLSLTVFQQSISETMPVTSLQVPLLGKLVYFVHYYSSI